MNLLPGFENAAASRTPVDRIACLIRAAALGQPVLFAVGGFDRKNVSVAINRRFLMVFDEVHGDVAAPTAGSAIIRIQLLWLFVSLLGPSAPVPRHINAAAFHFVSASVSVGPAHLTASNSFLSSHENMRSGFFTPGAKAID